MNRYRADIDGLRAIAILPVVLYHAGSPWFSGGFVGVDVFFVISGYLITGIIAREIATGTFSLAGFYVRRAKRILPSLFLVLGAVFALALFVLTPSELRNLGKMTAATAVFASNVMFFRESGYFDVSAERKPLLMTWSLGIEEQFYLLWPLALLLLAKWRRCQSAVLGIVGLTSFALACWGVTSGSSAAFYLLPSRAWELLLGAALALGSSRRPLRLGSFGNHAASLVGLTFIASAVFFLDKSSAFPGWNATLPCIGAVLLIWSGENAVGNRYVLSSRPLVFVGLISYPLYLWHWPLLSIFRTVWGPGLPIGLAFAVVALAVFLSVLTMHFIETPLRQARVTVPSATLARYGMLTALAFCIGGFTYLADGFPSLATADLLKADAARKDFNPLRTACLMDLNKGGGLPGETCLSRRPQQPVVAIWGDSHADALAPGVGIWADRQGYGFAQLTARACPPLPTAQVVFGTSELTSCARFNEQVTNTLIADGDIKVVFLVARWALYTENSRFGEDPGAIAYLTDEASKELSSGNSKRVFESALGRIVARLTSAGRIVMLVGQTPEIGLDVPACLEQTARRGRLGLPPRGCSVPADVVGNRLRFTNAIISKLALTNGSVRAFLPTDVLCNSKECRSHTDDVVLYYDDDHVSARGARLIAEHFGPVR